MRRLDEDETQINFQWYADISKDSNGKKRISFSMFDPVDWKWYYSFYSESNDTLKFCDNCRNEEKITVTIMRSMLNFIDSNEFKNIEIIDDDEYHEYIFEV